MAPTMSWSEAEHDPRVSESCGETGRVTQGTTIQLALKQMEIERLEDGFPQRLKELLL